MGRSGGGSNGTAVRRRMSSRLTGAVVAAGLMMWATVTPVSAATVTLEFSSLPSAQGWTYVNDGAPEGSVFTVDGTTLRQNSLSRWFETQRYDLFDVIEPSLPYRVSVRARVLEDSGSDTSNSFGFCFIAETPGDSFGIGLATNRIHDLRNVEVSSTIDNTVFHDYRLEVLPGTGYDFFVDDVLVASGPPRTDHFGANRLVLGDCTRGRGARAEVTAYEFEQVLPVDIDVKPGSDPNSVNPRSPGVIPVAVLGTDTFDVASIDVTTIRFGPSGTEAAPHHSALEDVDGDGLTDLVLHFLTQASGIICGDDSVSLTGRTASGQTVEGSDSLRTVGCR